MFNSCWKFPICLPALLAVTLAGCGLPISLGDQGSVATAAVQTYQAQIAQEASLRAPTGTTAPTATLESTPSPTATLLPSLTPTLTPSPTSTPDRGWTGSWNMFLEQLSKTPFNADVAQERDRVASTIYLKNEEYRVTGVVDAGGGRVSGAIYWHGEMAAYFIWQMQPGYNTFIGRWWKGEQSDMWCGGRNGVPAPPKSECLLRP